MPAVGPLGPQDCWLFARYELGRHATCGVDTLPSQKVPQKCLKNAVPPTWPVLLLNTVDKEANNSTNRENVMLLDITEDDTGVNNLTTWPNMVANYGMSMKDMATTSCLT